MAEMGRNGKKWEEMGRNENLEWRDLKKSPKRDINIGNTPKKKKVNRGETDLTEAQDRIWINETQWKKKAPLKTDKPVTLVYLDKENLPIKITTTYNKTFTGEIIGE